MSFANFKLQVMPTEPASLRHGGWLLRTIATEFLRTLVRDQRQSCRGQFPKAPMSCVSLPRRDVDVEQLANSCSTGRGRVIYVGGAQLSGRSELLRLVRMRLNAFEPKPLVVAGRLDSDGYRTARPQTDYRRWLRELAAFLPSTQVATYTVAPQLGIAADVLAVAATVLANAPPLVTEKELHQLSYAADPVQLADVMAKACLVRPVVIMLDDVDEGSGEWLNTFLSRTLPGLASRAPLIAICTTVAAAKPSYSDRYGISKLARDQMDRDLADWLQLAALDAADVQDWFGAMDDDVMEAVLTISLGAAGFIHDLWNQWQDQGLVDRTAPPELGGVWRFTDAARYRIPTRASATIHVELERIIPDPTERDKALEVLGVAALQGTNFSGAAVVSAVNSLTGQSRDSVSMYLKHLTDSSHGQPLIHLSSEDNGPGTPHLVSNYAFASSLQRQVILREAGGDDWRSKASAALARALAEVHRDDLARVARRITTLLLQADDLRGAERFQRLADHIPTSDQLLNFAETMVVLSDQGSAAMLDGANFLFALAQSRRRQVPNIEVAPLYRQCLAWSAACNAPELVNKCRDALAWVTASPESIDEADEHAAAGLSLAIDRHDEETIAYAYHAAAECALVRELMTSDALLMVTPRENVTRNLLRSYHHALRARDIQHKAYILSSVVHARQDAPAEAQATAIVKCLRARVESDQGSDIYLYPTRSIEGLIRLNRVAEAESICQSLPGSGGTKFAWAMYAGARGWVYFHQKQLSNARTWLQRSLRELVSLNSVYNIAVNLLRLAFVEDADMNRYGAIIVNVLACQVLATHGFAVQAPYRVYEEWASKLRMSRQKVEELQKRMRGSIETGTILDETGRAMNLPRQVPGIQR